MCGTAPARAWARVVCAARGARSSGDAPRAITRDGVRVHGNIVAFGCAYNARASHVRTVSPCGFSSAGACRGSRFTCDARPAVRSRGGSRGAPRARARAARPVALRARLKERLPTFSTSQCYSLITRFCALSIPTTYVFSLSTCPVSMCMRARVWRVHTSVRLLALLSYRAEITHRCMSILMLLP